MAEGNFNVESLLKCFILLLKMSWHQLKLVKSQSIREGSVLLMLTTGGAVHVGIILCHRFSDLEIIWYSFEGGQAGKVVQILLLSYSFLLGSQELPLVFSNPYVAIFGVLVLWFLIQYSHSEILGEKGGGTKAGIRLKNETCRTLVTMLPWDGSPIVILTTKNGTQCKRYNWLF